MKVKLKLNNNKSDCKSLKVLDLESFILFRPGCLNFNFRMPLPPKNYFVENVTFKGQNVENHFIKSRHQNRDIKLS